MTDANKTARVIGTVNGSVQELLKALSGFNGMLMFIKESSGTDVNASAVDSLQQLVLDTRDTLFEEWKRGAFYKDGGTHQLHRIIQNLEEGLCSIARKYQLGYSEDHVIDDVVTVDSTEEVDVEQAFDDMLFSAYQTVTDSVSEEGERVAGILDHKPLKLKILEELPKEGVPETPDSHDLDLRVIRCPKKPDGVDPPPPPPPRLL